MEDIDIRTVDGNTLVDIDSIVMDPNLSGEDRLLDYIQKVKNPFCFKCNGFIVKVVYEENGECLEDKLIGLFKSINGGL